MKTAYVPVELLEQILGELHEDRISSFEEFDLQTLCKDCELKLCRGCLRKMESPSIKAELGAEEHAARAPLIRELQRLIHEASR